VKKHGTDGKRRVWHKLHLAVDTNTHEIIAAELTLSGVTDAELLPNLLKQTPRTISEILGDGAYDARECHRAIRVKKATLLVAPRERAAFWEKVIQVIWQLAAKRSMARTKSGNRSMDIISGHCRRPLCTA